MTTAEPGTPTPGRPREFDADEAVEAALEVFWRHGFRDSTTRRLESALGITQSSLYAAFGSKRALYDAALDRYEDRISAALVEPLEAASDGAPAVDRFLVGLAVWITAGGRRGCMVANLMAEAGAADPDAAARAARYRRRVRRALRAALGRQPGVDRATADVAADSLMVAVLGLNLAARSGAGPAEFARLVDAARRLAASWERPSPPRLAGARRMRLS